MKNTELNVKTFLKILESVKYPGSHSLYCSPVRLQQPVNPIFILEI